MAEWVQKGNLKGPQGDPGQDAQLPAGGTEGQVLTKTSGGEAWADVPQPDMTGVVKKASLSSIDQFTALSADGSIIDALVIGNESSGEMVAMSEGMIQAASQEGSFALSPSTIYAASSKGSITVEMDQGLYLLISSGQHTAGFSVSGSSAGIQLDGKSVTSITDAITGSPAGDVLVTDKAVADYVTALVATDEEFDSVFGL